MEVLNDAMRLILAHGEMALSGMWQAEDDGVLNPWAVQLAPGSIVPIAQGSRGLMPLQLPQTRLDIGQIVLEEQRHVIRKALFNEQLGPREGTPPTAMEIEERMADLARQIGPAYGRVWHEVILGVIFRVLRILDDKGLVPPVEVDGETVRIVAASSLVRSARTGDVRRMMDWAAGTGQVFGPAAVQTLVKAEDFVRRTAELMDIPGDLLYSPEEIQRNAQRAGEIAGAAAADPSGQAQAAMAPLLAALGGGQA
jgi:hypothetical protein